MTRTAPLLLPTLLIVGLTACAARVPWVNPALPEKQWSKDWSACKRQAEYHTSGGYRDWDEPRTDPLAEYDRQHAKVEIDSSVESCMIGLGYVPAGRRR